MTLVEVLAGVAILGTMLTAVLLANGRYTRQWANSNRRIAAVAFAETLLVQWWADVDKLPRNASGVTDDSNFKWQTRIIDNDTLKEHHALVVRLEVFDHKPVAASFVRPLTYIDVVVPDESTQ